MFKLRRRRDGIILKSDSQIESMREAGRLSAFVLRKVGEIIEPGISTMELDSYVEGLIRREGGVPSFKGYGGFPGSICASVNEKVVHGIPSEDEILQEGDIISVDTGATVDGWVGDNAWTYAVGPVDASKMLLMEKTEESLWAGISQAVAGNRLGDVGFAIQRVLEDADLGVVREYVGHGIGRNMHEPPDVPNYGKRGRGVELEAGMVIAIEPMATLGTRSVHTIHDGWGVVTDDGLPAAHFEKTIAVTVDGPLVITAE